MTDSALDGKKSTTSAARWPYPRPCLRQIELHLARSRRQNVQGRCITHESRLLQLFRNIKKRATLKKTGPVHADTPRIIPREVPGATKATKVSLHEASVYQTHIVIHVNTKSLKSTPRLTYFANCHKSNKVCP